MIEIIVQLLQSDKTVEPPIQAKRSRTFEEKRSIRMIAKKTINRCFLGALLGLILVGSLGSTGCAVYSNGMTLPNPHYMNNRVQYFPSGTEFPFSKEAAGMQAAEADRL